MKVLTHNIRQEREDQRDRSAQLFMWCIVVSMHQDDGIGASRLLRACNEMDAFEKKYQTAILYGSSKNATDAMRENLKGICDFEVRLPVDRAPRGRREEQLRMASNQGAEIAWLVMAATCHETFGYGRDRLARLKQNSMNNYKQYLEWEKEDKDLALDRLRRCVQDALKEDLRVADTDDRKGMLSTPGRGPSVHLHLYHIKLFLMHPQTLYEDVNYYFVMPIPYCCYRGQSLSSMHQNQPSNQYMSLNLRRLPFL